jgi:phosphoglycolate phosphatase-like HAD superfamily hydrolase
MRFLPGSQIEVVNPAIRRGQIRHALFDFDGTVSLIREGWQGIMIPMMVEILLDTPHHESLEDLTAVVTEYVERLTGKQTIYQMIQLAEEVRQRGGNPCDPLDYKWRYLRKLEDHISGRVKGLASGQSVPEEMMVPGAVPMLEALRERGTTCYLASGTDEVYVRAEATALGVTSHFAGVYGAQDDYQNFSKRMVIERILVENQLQGAELVAFGDGYVEIEDTAAAGGIAVGVASDEARRQGVDRWKRERLIDAGADMIIGDFREYQCLVAYLFGEN